MEESLLVKEQKRWKQNFERIKRILKEANKGKRPNQYRFGNVNDVLEEALNLLEEKLKKEGRESAEDPVEA